MPGLKRHLGGIKCTLLGQAVGQQGGWVEVTQDRTFRRGPHGLPGPSEGEHDVHLEVSDT